MTHLPVPPSRYIVMEPDEPHWQHVKTRQGPEPDVVFRGVNRAAARGSGDGGGGSGRGGDPSIDGLGGEGLG